MSTNEFSCMKGKKMVKVEGRVGQEEMRFTDKDGGVYKFYHDQDCCESVSIDDIVGDLDDLVGSPILRAEETTDGYNEAPENANDSYTWTFYTFTTRKGIVTVKWLGQSNGYYSERVCFTSFNLGNAKKN